MPGFSSSQTALRAGNVLPLHPQVIELTGLNSPPQAPRANSDGARGAARDRANPAWSAPATERTRRMEWLAIGLPHNSSHLFARLPFGDAVQLSALAGTAQMTWPEINAALDARIKLAIAELRAGRGGRYALADPHKDWEQAKRAGEDEIWARYHAKCDAVFADGTSSETTGPWWAETVRDRERRLNLLRAERDRALAALAARLGPQPPRRASTAQQNQSAPTQLSANERDALHKLDASGFVGSHLMTEAIHDLAMPLAETIDWSA